MFADVSQGLSLGFSPVRLIHFVSKQYNYALAAYQHDPCAGLPGNYDQTTGQGSETGRDQGHAVTSLGWAAEAARVMQSQGWEDSYTILDNLVLKGGEYAAKYNLGYDVPYDRKFYRCEAILVKGPWAQPSEIKRGIVGSPKVWDVSFTRSPPGQINVKLLVDPYFVVFCPKLTGDHMT